MTAALVILALLDQQALLDDRSTAYLEGTVGDLPVRMQIQRRGNELFGYYLYATHYQAIWFKGAIAAGGTFTLASPQYEDGPHERFIGRATADRLEGSWVSRDGRRNLPFALGRLSDWRSVPGSWVSYRSADCPIEFPYPPGWTPKVSASSVTLRLHPRSSHEVVEIAWGRGTKPDRIYVRRRGRWFIPAEVMPPDTPVELVERDGLKVSYDENECRAYSDQGYAGLSTCQSSLILGNGFWVVLATDGVASEDAFRILLAHLRAVNDPERSDDPNNRQ